MLVGIFKELIEEGHPIDEEILAEFAPYRTENINRFGDYFLDMDRDFKPLSYKTRILKRDQ